MITPADMSAILAAVGAQQGPPSIGEGFPNPVASSFQAGDTVVITSNGLAVYNGPPTGQVMASIDAGGNIQAQTLSANSDIILAGQSLTAELAALAAAPVPAPGPWIPMSLIGGATAPTSPNVVPSYQLSADGTKVYLTGQINGVKSLTVFATLPAGYFNPAATPTAPVAIVTYPSSPSSMPYVQSDLSGNLIIHQAPGGGASSTVMLGGYLDIGIGSSSLVTSVATFYPAQSWSYYGNTSQRDYNGTLYQGQDPANPSWGAQFSYLDFSAVAPALAAGTINSATLRLLCQSAYYSTGMDASLFAASGFGGSGHLNGSNCLDQWAISPGQLLTHTLAPAVLSYLASSSWPYLVLASDPWNSSSASYYGAFYGAGGSTAYMPKLAVNWTH